MIGHIDKVTNSFVSGWACSSFDSKDDRVKVFIDDKLVQEFTPDINRPGLVEKGIHKNGLCAFRIGIEDLDIDLKKEHKVSVRILKDGNFVDVDNSPFTFQPKEWIQELLIDSRAAKGQKTLIVGLPKSGTSALTVSIGNSYPKAIVHFEPNRQNGLKDVEFHARVTSQNTEIIAKCLYFGVGSSSLKQIEQFYDKCIWIYRDPRDWLISNFLYIWYHVHDLPKSQFQKALRAVENKEKNPASVDFLPLLELERGLEWYSKKLSSCASEIQRIKNDERWCLLRFEDFLNGNFQYLSDYLGTDIIRTKSLPDNIKRVERAVAHGYWKDWFTGADQRIFEDRFDEIMVQMGYDMNEEVHAAPSINPKFSSEYMLKINSGGLN